MIANFFTKRERTFGGVLIYGSIKGVKEEIQRLIEKGVSKVRYFHKNYIKKTNIKSSNVSSSLELADITSLK